MLDLTHRQTRILFELSNGKSLIVSDKESEAFICGEKELDDPRRGIATKLDDVRRLVETDCLRKERRVLVGLSDATAYAVSPGGLETLLETGLRLHDD